MFRIIFIAILLVFSIATIHAQEVNEEISTNNQDFKKGLTFSTEVGGGFYRGLSLVNVYQHIAYKASPNFTVGLGVGAYIHRPYIEVPIVLDIRVPFIDKKISPFFGLSAGYNLLTSKYTFINGTFREIGHAGTATASFGVNFRFKDKAGLVLNGGYKTVFNNGAVHGGFLRLGFLY